MNDDYTDPVDDINEICREGLAETREDFEAAEQRLDWMQRAWEKALEERARWKASRRHFY